MALTIEGNRSKFKSFFVALEAQVRELVQRKLEAQLEAEVTSWLHRTYHQRRHKVSRQSRAVCQRCGTQQASAFSRNGHRPRQLVSRYGVINFWLPRVICACGGSVRIPFSLLHPYQRLWEDLVEQIGRWAVLGLSLRQMQGEIGDQMHTQIGLRKLNEVVQQIRQPPELGLTSVPPIIMLDAIWVTRLTATPETYQDNLKRQRHKKVRQKVCVLVALGLYPQSQRWGILGWQLAKSENQDAWEALLLPLEARGVYQQRGVELFIHDGGKGLIAALDLLYPHIPHQRCLFHKLRNLWHAMQAPPDLTGQARIDFKKDLLQQVTPILYAKTLENAVQIRDELVEQWHHTQAALAATLQRDWHETIAFFRVLARYPNWQRTALRTTSLLERLNRMLRRLFRAAGAYHSTSGLLATVTRVLAPFWLT